MMSTRRLIPHIIFGVTIVALTTSLTAGAGATASPARPLLARPPGAAGSSTASWGRAQPLRGIDPLLTGGGPQPLLACGGPGSCVAAGDQVVGPRFHVQPFVADEVRGTWQRARVLPGITALDGAHSAFVEAVSCAAAGSCLAIGQYSAAKSGQELPFVARQVHGLWRAAITVPGITKLTTTGPANVKALACPALGACVIGGEYWNATAQALEPFVSRQVRGTWRAPMPLPGGQALNQGVEAEVTLLSCSSPGNCAAAGFYTNAPNSTLPFVDSQVAGAWGAAINVPGLAAQNAPNLGSLACGRAGACAGGGSFATASQAAHAFVANVAHGTWGTAQELRGIVNTGRRRADAGVAAIWCGRSRCLAGGFYVDRAGGVQPFIVRQVGGTWGAPIRLPGIVLLSRLNAELGALSCASAGNCAVGGTYNLARPGFSGPPKAFVAAQVSGTWLRPVEVPGIAALHPHGPVVIVAVSCPARGACVAFGAYRVRTTPSGTVDAGFVVSQR